MWIPSKKAWDPCNTLSWCLTGFKMGIQEIRRHNTFLMSDNQVLITLFSQHSCLLDSVNYRTGEAYQPFYALQNRHSERKVVTVASFSFKKDFEEMCHKLKFDLLLTNPPTPPGTTFCDWKVNVVNQSHGCRSPQSAPLTQGPVLGGGG